jgi:hypothetical protein
MAQQHTSGGYKEEPGVATNNADHVSTYFIFVTLFFGRFFVFVFFFVTRL